MRTLPLLLILLLSTPVWAHSIEYAACRAPSTPVQQMESAEKFCRSFARALHKLPQATTDEARALLSPESLALMTAMTAAWVGTQGVPIVGQAVDAALMAAGVILLTAQSAALANTLWQYAHLTSTARSPADLDAAADYLSRAISTVGINLVAFVLTKQTLGKGRPGPMGPSPGLLMAQGPSTASVAVGMTHSPALAPALAMAGSVPPPSRGQATQGTPPKAVDSKAFAQWIQTARKRPTRNAPEAYRYQQRQAGPEEVLVQGGGEQVWADGARMDQARLVEAKFIDTPEKSPFIPDSKCNESVRRWVHQELFDEFRRYAAVITDPNTPAVALEVVTNDARAAPFFESLLHSFNLPGEVVIKR